MSLQPIDWIIILIFLSITIYIGFRFRGAAGKSLQDFFLGGRKFPWYLAGISMVATTFAADTPLFVTGVIAKQGISGNWIWWNMLIGGMLTTFFFARLWRRSGVLTEIEFITLRYGGKPAKILRQIKAVYLGLIMNGAIIAWVNVAMLKILMVFFGIERTEALLIILGLSILIALYSTLSGIWGVAVNDFIQFFVAMTGSIALAWFVIKSPEIGGISSLTERLPNGTLDFFPSLGSANGIGLSIGLASFLAFLGFQWWTSWYPGGEPGGGGYIAQRMMSARTEKDAFLSTLFFQFAHYCLRPWPWIIVGLACVIIYPGMGENAYVHAMKDFLPAGWKGLMLVAFGAAYMSTISTQLNWGAGYITNDLIKPSLKNPDDKQLVSISRWSTIGLAISGSLISLGIESIESVWVFVLECGAGLGLVLILRWYWWRINAWAEITATIVPFLVFLFCRFVLASYDPSWAEGLMVNPKSFFFNRCTYYHRMDPCHVFYQS